MRIEGEWRRIERELDNPRARGHDWFLRLGVTVIAIALILNLFSTQHSSIEYHPQVERGAECPSMERVTKVHGDEGLPWSETRIANVSLDTSSSYTNAETPTLFVSRCLGHIFRVNLTVSRYGYRSTIELTADGHSIISTRVHYSAELRLISTALVPIGAEIGLRISPDCANGNCHTVGVKGNVTDRCYHTQWD